MVVLNIFCSKTQNVAQGGLLGWLERWLADQVLQCLIPALSKCLFLISGIRWQEFIFNLTCIMMKILATPSMGKHGSEHKVCDKKNHTVCRTKRLHKRFPTYFNILSLWEFCALPEGCLRPKSNLVKSH